MVGDIVGCRTLFLLSLGDQIIPGKRTDNIRPIPLDGLRPRTNPMRGYHCRCLVASMIEERHNRSILRGWRWLLQRANQFPVKRTLVPSWSLSCWLSHHHQWRHYLFLLMRVHYSFVVAYLLLAGWTTGDHRQEQPEQEDNQYHAVMCRIIVLWC